MATWTMPDWAKGEEIGEATALPDQVADRNLDLDCNFSLDVKVARTHYTGSQRLVPPVELTSEKSGLSLDEDSILDGDLESCTPTGGALIPGISEIELPKHTITADPLDLSMSDGDEVENTVLTKPLEINLSKPLETIPEDPELEAQLQVEQENARSPEELSTHMEEEPAPLRLRSLSLQDQEMSTEPTQDNSETRLQQSVQSLSEAAVKTIPSDLSAKEERSASTVIIIEELPKAPGHVPASGESSPTSVVLPFSKRIGSRKKTTETSRASAPLKPNRATKFLEKIHMAEGHDTNIFPLAEDLMSLEGVQKSGDRVKKEEFGELFTKHPFTSVTSDNTLPTAEESEDEEVVQDFDHLPIRTRMDIWKRREHRAIRKGLILIPKITKQGRFPISAWV